MYDHIQNHFDMEKTWHKLDNKNVPPHNPYHPYLRQHAAMCIFPNDPNKFLIAGGLSSNQTHTITYNS